MNGGANGNGRISAQELIRDITSSRSAVTLISPLKRSILDDDASSSDLESDDENKQNERDAKRGMLQSGSSGSMSSCKSSSGTLGRKLDFSGGYKSKVKEGQAVSANTNASDSKAENSPPNPGDFSISPTTVAVSMDPFTPNDSSVGSSQSRTPTSQTETVENSKKRSMEQSQSDPKRQKQKSSVTLNWKGLHEQARKLKRVAHLEFDKRKSMDDPVNIKCFALSLSAGIKFIEAGIARNGDEEYISGTIKYFDGISDMFAKMPPHLKTLMCVSSSFIIYVHVH